MVKKLKDSILELRDEGKSINDIKKILNCSKGTISYHINKHGMGGVLEEFKTKSDDNEFIKDIGDDIVTKIIESKKNGKTYKEIYLSLNNISYDKIKRICSIFKLNRNNSLVKFEDSVFIELIKTEYKRLGSIKKVAKLLSVGHRKVREYVEVTKQTTEDRQKNLVIHVHNHRKQRKQDVLGVFGVCCQICGYNKSLKALQFHHIDPNEKDFSLGGRNYSMVNMKKEADKCVLLCSNCHVEIHEEIYEFGFSKFIEEYKNRRLE